MSLLNTEIFLKEGTFLSKLKENSIDFILNHSDAHFGEQIIMYYFYKKGYNITFLYEVENKKIVAEQVEVYDNITNDAFLNSIMKLDDFKKKLKENIKESYSDDDENVIFMKNGVNVYFVNKVLSKITSLDDISRKFIMSFMKKDA